ncbi:MAG TPA: YihY/virulence factor BrkB family protein [Acetobacteraceae bacterium]|nr:YihY/virulence factor BrkB family protein [Acetobacteraceae bacterium]
MAAKDREGIGFGIATLLAAALVYIATPPRVGVARGTAPAARMPGRRPHGRGGSAGHDAHAPSEIPARGWWSILKRVVNEVNENRLMTEAAGITFYALLSIFPGLAALVSLAGLVLDPATVTKDVDALAGMIPGGGMDVLHDQLQRLTTTSSGALSIGLVTGLLISLWTSNQAMKALFDSLNKVYGETEKRGYVKRTLLTLAFTIGALLFVVVAMAFVVVLPIVLNFVGLGSVTDLLLRIARWPVLLVAITLFLALVYRYGPSREQAQWRWISWGSVFASVVWVLGSLAFSWYVSSFGSYNETYGSLGAVVGFMTWIWLSSLVILIGGQLDAEMEYQTAVDTTTGPPRPIGQRGAAKADAVAPV